MRLWNYTTGNCELARVFYTNKRDEEYESTDTGEKIQALKHVAFHPSGYYLAVVCPKKILLTNVLDDNLYTFKQIELKECQTAAFSNGGALFVAAGTKFVYVYEAMQVELLAKMKAPNTPVSEIRFSPDDKFMTVISADGFMDIYDMFLTRIEVKTKKGIQIIEGKKCGPDGKPLPDYKEYEFPKLGDGVIDKSCRFNSCEFISELKPQL